MRVTLMSVNMGGGKMELKGKMALIRRCKEDIMNSAGSLCDVGHELRDNEGTEAYGQILLVAADVAIMAMSDLEWMIKD